MRIAIPVVGFSRAGGERVLSRVASELIDKGHDVFFVVPDNLSTPYYPTNASIVRSFVERRYNKYINYIINYYALYKKCKELKPDLVIANYNLTAYLVFLLPRSIIKVYYIQAYEVLFGTSKLRKAIAYFTYFLPLNKIVNHDKILPSSINNYITVIPAGVDVNNFTPRKLTNAKKNIGLIGRREKHKGTSELINIIIEWGREKEFILNIGVYLDDYTATLLKEADIEFNYYLINDDKELADFYRRNDLIVAVGLVEDGAFHYPCAEAMACGCLVISNYAPLVNTKSILRIQSFSRECILNKLDIFYNMNSEQIKKELSLYTIIRENYSWDVIGEKFNNTLTELYNNEIKNECH
ncbi:glycosyltransferase family 4 protein [Escherichia albertii]|uniref:glycosyltransferase family 4 protein n=1 Tax=Escherichia albertii TaxID=208962 RepID=UPI001374A22D|nr:glycosyltransferase family 4 protein [Escherichia albertii]MCU7289880.1 glycosyltransferase family 4 protein [Escherichia albertii]QTA15954.1 glycosyltransferase family 4 protein [Escherichia albertii]HAX3034873.1 glycosyltransferase family 4 protein [Escherichia albertii]